jgi:DNA-binding MarR family transcriptional regulator
MAAEMQRLVASSEPPWTGWKDLMPQAMRRPSGKSAGRYGQRAPPGAVDYHALARFRYQLRLFLAFRETAAQELGLTPRQHQALLGIKGFAGPGPASIGDLARFLLIRHHTAVELVNRMTKLGLLSRVADADDGRRVLVRLTKKGEQRLQALSSTHIEELRSVNRALAKFLRSLDSPR